MIISKVRAKNFFSIGNDFIEMDIEKYRRSLIGGVNGRGKSTLINAIVFGLFGKTIKQITKPLIVNSINNKNCMVEVDLKANGNDYLIRRGIKPNVFEIFENGTLLDQTLVGDYQDYLEKEILHCSYRTFLQTSILSVENYKPFMALGAAERRAFVEDILDIKVFSVMDSLIKSVTKKNKEAIAVAEREVATIKSKGEVLKSAIDKIDLMNSNSTETLEQELSDVEIELEAARTRLEALQIESSTFDSVLSELRSKRRSRDDLKSKGMQLKTKMDAVTKTIDFFTKSDACPTCTQPIDPKNVGEIVSTHQCEHDDLMTELKKIARELQ
jgi:DNA repair exonuclease SbcCD ATPase subunit